MGNHQFEMFTILMLLFMYLSLNDVKAAKDFSIDTEITTPQGKIKGSVDLSGSIRRFLGIPYASITGRFQEPVAAQGWNGTLDATKDSPACKQCLYLSDKLQISVGAENCLALNIYTPITAVARKLPVMVFIHGGGFVTGSKSDFIYDPKYLVEKNNIVVTINYRLGALGFLCLKNKGAPGNVGLKDQVAALKWINKNIDYFGGNSDLITLFGQDVGAASINYFLGTPATKDLFHRVILQSGSALMPQAFDDNPIASASAIAAESGFNSTDPDELLQFFNDLPIDELVRATSKGSSNDPFAPYVFRPCIEAPSEGALITDHPRNLFKSAKHTDIHIIIGYNNREGIEWASKLNYSDLPSLIGNLKNIIIPNYLQFQDEQDQKVFMKDMKKMYISNEMDSTSVMSGLIDYFSDAYIMYPSVITTEDLLNHTAATIFNYQFSYMSILNFGKLLQGTTFWQFQGASHGDELFYLFNPLTPSRYLSLPPFPNDVVQIYRMTMMWSYFALTGNPSIPVDSRLPYPVEWEDSKRENLKFLDIFSNFKMTSLPNKKRIDFWKNAYEKYGKYN